MVVSSIRSSTTAFFYVIPFSPDATSSHIPVSRASGAAAGRAPLACKPIQGFQLSAQACSGRLIDAATRRAVENCREMRQESSQILNIITELLIGQFVTCLGFIDHDLGGTMGTIHRAS